MPPAAHAELVTLADGVSVWLQHPAGHGMTNAGVVVDEDGITVVDALLVPSQAAPLARELDRLGRRVRRLVYSSSHIEFTGGSTMFPLAARYGTTQTSVLLDQPPNPAAWGRLHRGHDDEFAELTTRPVSHTVTEPAWLSVAVTASPTGGQQSENLVVQVPSTGVVFLGAMGCFATTPLAFDGDPSAWADALGVLSSLGATFVPGIGPVGAEHDLVVLQAYLYACADAAGDPSTIPAGPWDDWPDRHFDRVNVQRCAMLADGDLSTPPAMLELLGLA